jgi:hypothetical protein
VFTSVVRLDAVNALPDETHVFRIVQRDGELAQRQLHTAGKDEYTIEPGITVRTGRSSTGFSGSAPDPGGHAEWALGIVTGDNRRLLAREAEPEARPILRGRDIQPNRLRPPQRWLRPGMLQQTAPERFYRPSENRLPV